MLDFTKLKYTELMQRRARKNCTMFIFVKRSKQATSKD